MDNYILAEDRETECPVPFPKSLLTDLQFPIGKNTKVGTIVAKVEKMFQKEDVKRFILFGVGEYSAKCVAFAEVFKSRLKWTPLYQWTELKNSKSVDIWAPSSADERLDKIVVEKYVPKVFILFSKEPFPEEFRCAGQQPSTEKFPSFLKHDDRAGTSSKTRSANFSRPLSGGGLTAGRSHKRKDDGGDAGGSGITGGPAKRRGENQWRRPAKPQKARGPPVAPQNAAADDSRNPSS